MNSMLLYHTNHAQHSTLNDKWIGQPKCALLISGAMRTGGHYEETQLRIAYAQQRV